MIFESIFAILTPQFSKTGVFMAGSNTPMMQQYWDLREENPGFLLFYRMGDFYELFDDHAITAAGVLGITLTKRRSSKDGDEGIPMCGVPFHAAEGYIAKLIKHGHKVALCEQTETPEEAKKARGYKALVKREIVRLYTGGTLTEESMLKAEENNYLLAILNEKNTIHLAYADVSTGEFKSSTTTADNLGAELSRLNPKEVILTESTGEKFISRLLGAPCYVKCQCVDFNIIFMKKILDVTAQHRNQSTWHRTIILQ